jgi:hypothetical protein
MSATFTWSVVQMNCAKMADGETDVVFNVQWSCEGQQASGGETFSGAQNGNTLVQYRQGDPFTPYDQLTQQQVLGWVWANPTTSQAIIEAQIQQDIDRQINNPVVTPPLPWAPPAA